MLLGEQNAKMALQFADRVYFIDHGTLANLHGQISTKSLF